MGFFDIFKTHESSESSRRSPKKKKGASSSKKRSWPRKSTQPQTLDTSTSTPSRKLTKAERSAANKKAWAEKGAKEKELHRKQRELESKAAATKQGSKRRRDVFKTRREYEEYLSSETWKRKRDEERTRAQGKCTVCGKAGSSVHHTRYTEPGAEAPSHLAFVCNNCHRRMHGTQR